MESIVKYSFRTNGNVSSESVDKTCLNIVLEPKSGYYINIWLKHILLKYVVVKIYPIISLSIPLRGRRFWKTDTI